MDFDESLAQLQQLLLKHDEGQGRLLLFSNSRPWPSGLDVLNPFPALRTWPVAYVRMQQNGIKQFVQ